MKYEYIWSILIFRNKSLYNAILCTVSALQPPKSTAVIIDNICYKKITHCNKIQNLIWFVLFFFLKDNYSQIINSLWASVPASKALILCSYCYNYCLTAPHVGILKAKFLPWVDLDNLLNTPLKKCTLSLTEWHIT